MRKTLICLGVFTVVIYLCFAVLPEYAGFSFPTGGWDWLSYVAIIAGLFVTAWGIIETINNNAKVTQKQLIMSAKPCLDADIFRAFSAEAQKNVFRKLYFGSHIINNGYILLRDETKTKPDDFYPSANIKVRNVGLSTALNIIVSLEKLDSVDGLHNLDQIKSFYIRDFYSRVRTSNFKYNENDIIRTDEWIIAPSYNLNNSTDEFNLVFDQKDVATNNHCILKFRFEDVYGTLYYQMVYFYFASNQVVALPISKVFDESERSK